MNTGKIELKFGLYSTLSLVILTIITWGFGMIAVPPAGPYCPGDCMSYPFPDILMYYPEANVLVPRNHDAQSQTPSFKSIDVVLTEDE